jgi:hypothetical protein
MAGDSESAVVTVGKLRLTVSDVQQRLATVPPFQLEALGNAERATRRWVEAALVPELLYAQEAAALGLPMDSGMQDRIRAVLAEALVLDLERHLERTRPVTDQEIRRRFEQERTTRGTPRRVRVFRILLASQERAKKLIEESRGAAGLARWADRARELSLDQATRMRAGDLGFVRPDGSTDVPGLRVDPSLFEAAERVMDGELVGEPVPEAGQFAVVWRRGSLPEQKAVYAREAPALRQSILRARTSAELLALLGELRRNRVTIVAESLVDGVSANPGSDFRAGPRPEPVDGATSPAPPATPSGGPSPVP